MKTKEQIKTTHAAQGTSANKQILAQSQEQGPSHIQLVKPTATARLSGDGCRPTGVQ